MTCSFLFGGDTRAFVSLDVRAQTSTGVNIGHGCDVLPQSGNIDDHCWGGQIINMHSAGEGPRTPNTQALNLLPLPIGLHRRHHEGTRDSRGAGV